ncbi:MAG: DUF4340 domain-containing protein [bacterium]
MRKNFVVPAVFFVLVIAAAVHHFVKKTPSGIKPFGKVKEVLSIKITDFSKNENYTLIKEDGKWLVDTSTSHIADALKVDNLSDKIQDLKFETVISETKEKHFEYSVSSQNAISISVRARNFAPSEVYIGKAGADYAHFYARFRKKPQVYLASGFSRYEVALPAEFFRDRKIADIPEEDIKSVSISDNKLFYTVERSSAGWLFQGKKPEGVDGAIQLCRAMSAFDFSDKGIQDFKPLQKIIIMKISGEIFEWHIGQKVENFYLAKRTGRNDIYKISSGQAEKIIKFLEKNSQK